MPRIGFSQDKNPMATVAAGEAMAVAVLNRNEAALTCVPAWAHGERMPPNCGADAWVAVRTGKTESPHGDDGQPHQRKPHERNDLASQITTRYT